MKKALLIFLLVACLASLISVPVAAADDPTTSDPLVPGIELAYFSNAQGYYEEGDPNMWAVYVPGAVPPIPEYYALAPYSFYFINNTPFRTDQYGNIPEGTTFSTDTEMFVIMHGTETVPEDGSQGRVAFYYLVNVRTGAPYNPGRYRAFSVFFAEGDGDSLWADGYFEGYNEGFKQGQTVSNNVARDEGYQAGLSEGRQSGFDEGYAAGVKTAGEGTFRSLITSVVEVPFNTLQSMFDFTILGMNMQVAIGSILTLCMIVIIIKFVV